MRRNKKKEEEEKNDTQTLPVKSFTKSKSKPNIRIYLKNKKKHPKNGVVHEN